MPPTELSPEDLDNWLRGAGHGLSSNQIAASLQFYQQRSQQLTVDIGGIIKPDNGDDAPMVGTQSLQESMNALETTQSTIEKLHSLQSPIRRLPPELLSEIFAHALPGDMFLSPSPTQAPLILGQVCGYWRDICLSTPKLWSSLLLQVKQFCPEDGITPMQHDTHLRILELWMSRSGGYPFSLSIQDDFLQIAEVEATIRAHSSHWAHLKILVPRDAEIRLPRDAPFSMLRSLEIQSPAGLTDDAMEDITVAMASAPNLRSFVWDNSRKRQPFSISLNWSSLTRLTINTSISIVHCLMILTEAHEMTHLTFQDICVPSVAPSITVTLPKLISFVIYTAAGDFSPVFDAVSFPGLREIVLNLRFWPHASFVGFLTRSNCPLESLNLYWPQLTEADLIQCLEKVQGTLKEFTVQTDHEAPAPVTDILLDRLTDDGSGEVLCPHVDVIALYESICCSPGRFARMARSRLRPVKEGEASSSSGTPRRSTCLKVIELYSDESEMEYLKPLRSFGLVLKAYSPADGSPVEMEPEDVGRLKELRKEGLVLRVYTPDTGHFGVAD